MELTLKEVIDAEKEFFPSGGKTRRLAMLALCDRLNQRLKREVENPGVDDFMVSIGEMPMFRYLVFCVKGSGAKNWASRPIAIIDWDDNKMISNLAPTAEIALWKMPISKLIQWILLH